MESKVNRRILRMKDLPPKVGLQPSTLYGLIAVGKFPKPHKLVPGGRAAGWEEADVCPSSYKMGHYSGLSIGGSGSFV